MQMPENSDIENVNMIQVIEKLDASLLEIQPVIEYLEKFKKFEIINEDIDADNGEIDILHEQELIRIMYITISGGKFWSIYRYHSDGTKYEQIDIILFDEIKENEYNRVIKYSGHIEDDSHSYITCSGFSFLDDQLIRSWKQTRVVLVQDLGSIQYSKDMNLTELIIMTDNKISNIIKQEEYKDVTLVLKLEKL